MWTDLLVGVLDLQSSLLRLVSELVEPPEEQRVRAGGQDAFPTQPDRLRSWHPSGSDRRETSRSNTNPFPRHTINTKREFCANKN